tara:strand:- start:3772 stop:4014 length:243 start_codon:yes stop_codon:yes gene_type:complete
VLERPTSYLRHLIDEVGVGRKGLFRLRDFINETHDNVVLVVIIDNNKNNNNDDDDDDAYDPRHPLSKNQGASTWVFLLDT